MMKSDEGKALALVLGLTAVVSILLLAFALPGVHSKPNDIPLAVVAPAAATEQISRALEERQPGGFEVTAVGDEAQARRQILDRRVEGALVVQRDSTRVLVTTAGSPAVATLIETIGQQMGTQMHSPVTVVDVRGFGTGDPKGVGLAAGALPLALGGWIGGVALMMMIRRPRNLVLATLGFAVLAGLAINLLMRYVLGTFDTAFWYLVLSGILGIAATAFGVIGLRRLLGGAGLGIAAILLVVLGNPLSGLSSSPDLLPSPWGAIGQLLPPGATGTLLRNVGFFNGHNIIHPIVVLTVWLVAGLGLYAIALWRQTDVSEDDELIDEVIGIDGAAHAGAAHAGAAHNEPASGEDSAPHGRHEIGHVVEMSAHSSSAGHSFSGHSR
ncbi:ABC transporter permease [Gordonia polyisoprenivorans]|uniref:ABC transporter permease n=1 Tax=Gordonia polyisoprenivorans TaxID=84595 RepID=UPI001F0A9DA4|nr:ABC transporter permease [Gordonia polyisoprenivorans]